MGTAATEPVTIPDKKRRVDYTPSVESEANPANGMDETRSLPFKLSYYDKKPKV